MSKLESSLRDEDRMTGRVQALKCLPKFSRRYEGVKESIFDGARY